MTPQVPSREPPRGQFALAVPRRHQQHQAVNLPALYPLQLPRNRPVEASSAIIPPGVLSEGYQARFRVHPPQQLHCRQLAGH